MVVKGSPVTVVPEMVIGIPPNPVVSTPSSCPLTPFASKNTVPETTPVSYKPKSTSVTEFCTELTTTLWKIELPHSSTVVAEGSVCSCPFSHVTITSYVPGGIEVTS